MPTNRSLQIPETGQHLVDMLSHLVLKNSYRKFKSNECQLSWSHRRLATYHIGHLPLRGQNYMLNNVVYITLAMRVILLDTALKKVPNQTQIWFSNKMARNGHGDGHSTFSGDSRMVNKNSRTKTSKVATDFLFIPPFSSLKKYEMKSQNRMLRIERVGWYTNWSFPFELISNLMYIKMTSLNKNMIDYMISSLISIILDVLIWFKLP